ncbi:sialin [Episyrphus balteatus]|uniref:sialin n=1 Tax=Episyrphus balteatus TaxID=286459 RepID=UPI0024850DE9|nr:sialin [Episyrphus balteatus]XP_055858838.1 sialin [Episyrphus balteatus]
MTFVLLPCLKGFSIPKRFNIGVMLFMMCLIAYMARVNFSLNIIAMTESTKNNNETLPDQGPRYKWSADDQALLLGAYFYGYLITSLPGGMLAERYGGKAVAGYSSIFSAVLTALTPLAASWGIWAVFAVRFAIGFLGGVVYPCCHCLISKWSPPQEKGKFVAALMGGTFGTVITWPISGIIVEGMGWPWAFYMIAIFIAIVTAVWFIIVDDSPAQHTTITTEERDLIQKSLGDSLSSKKRLPPFKDVAMSLPFWSLLLLHYGSMWGLFFLITAAPKFMSEVLKFNLSSAGFLSSLPHLARLLCAFGFGAVADTIRRKEWISVTKIRKYFCIPSHIIPGLFLIILAFYGRSPYVCVAIMTLSLGFNGAATVTNLANSQDLAPNYAGTLYGTINFVGTTPGIFSPMIVAYFTKDQNTIDQWQNIFLIGAGAYILPAFVFWALGSGKIQKWNEIDKDSNQTDVINTKL